MKKSIMNIDDAVMLCFESGSARIRLKREMTRYCSREHKVNELNND